MKYDIYTKKPVETKLKAFFDKISNNGTPYIVFSLGGDGTMLNAVRNYQNKLDEVIFVGINTGRLGFYAEYKANDLDLLVDKIEKGTYKIREYSLLECEIIQKDGKKIEYCLNEIAITNPIHTQIIEVYINDEYFETFRGTGFLLSTPSGSTAYNKSLGGAIFDSSFEAFQLTEIAPINNRIYQTLNSPILFNKGSVVTLKLNYSNNVFVSCDGLKVDVCDLVEVNIKLSDKKVKFISNEKDYYSRIKQAFLDINIFK